METVADYTHVVRRFITLAADRKPKFLERLRENGIDFMALPIPPDAARFGSFRLSSAQHRLWFLWNLEPHRAAYNISGLVRLRGLLDRLAFEQAYGGLLERHASLRTRFPLDAEGLPIQCVDPPVSAPLILHDLSGMNAEKRATRVRRLARAYAREPFQLDQRPPVRAALLKLDDREHVLLLTMHHIVTDGWSTGVLIDDLARLYAARVAGRRGQLPPLPIEFADYAVWQRAWLEAGGADVQLAYWQRQLGDEHSPLALSTDRPRPAQQSYRGAVRNLTLDPALVLKLRTYARVSQASSFMVLLAAFKLLLFRYTGQVDIRVGVPFANRDRLETEGVIGCFVNTVVMRTFFDGRWNFDEVLSRVRETVLEAHAHRDVPFERVVETLRPQRSLSHNPLFQIMVNHQFVRNRAMPAAHGGLRFELKAADKPTTQFDLSLDLLEGDASIDAVFTFATDLFNADTVERIAVHWLALLRAALEYPQQPVIALDMMDVAERRRLLEHWGVGPVSPLDARCSHQLIEEQAARMPEAVAVDDGDEPLTYSELNAIANRLAHYLISQGIGPEQRVGISMTRSAAMLAGLLGILKAGAAYVPLDPDSPPERLSWMIEDAGIKLLLAQADRRKLLPTCAARIIEFDTSSAWLAVYSDADPSPRATLLNLAYCIYTSGSTGRPKGVQVPHRSLTNKVVAAGQRFGIGPGFRSAWLASIAFDMSIEQSLYALGHGGCVIPVDNETRASAQRFWRLVEEREITMVDYVPSFIDGVLDDAPRLPLQLDWLVLGGEAYTSALDRRVRQRIQVGRVVNLYGPTEIGIDAIGYDVPPGEHETMPIGTPLPNYCAYIVDGWLNPVPVGVKGELYIGGEGLARGYGNRPGLSAERFVPNPFNGFGERLYRTGDLARWRTDGTIEYLGRIDHQLKIRGFRVEPAEVEAALLSHPAVREAVVVAHDVPAGTPGTKRLVGYVTCTATAGGDVPLTGTTLRSHLHTLLPDYMVPSQIAVLAHMPLTPNGKLDRSALPQPVRESTAHAAPQTSFEIGLAQIWGEVLQTPHIGIDDNFFELGGDSIVAIQMIGAARRAGILVAPKDVFQQQTIRGLASVAKKVDAHESSTVPVRGEMPLTPIQRRFFLAAIPERSHWNQSVFLACRQDLDIGALKRALELLQRHHDALRLHFSQQPSGGWCATHAPEPHGAVVWDMSAVDGSELERLCESAQASLNLEKGPLLRALHVRLVDGSARLLLVIHHLIVDGVSWRVLLTDLQHAYKGYVVGTAVELPAKTCSFQEWSERMAAYARSAAVAAQLPYWREQCRGPGIPRDYAVALGIVADAKRAVMRLSRTATTALLTRAQWPYRTSVDTLLLSALAIVLCRWSAQDSVVVEVETHGRDGLPNAPDVSRTVGWMTGFHPMRLAPAASVGATIKAVKEQLHAVPDKGIGFGLLQYAGNGTVGVLGHPRVAFNYLGQLDQSLGKESLFSPATEHRGSSFSLRAPLEYWLTIDGAVLNGCLELSFGYDGRMYRQETMEWLSAEYGRELEQVIEHCVSEHAGGLTPSDVPLSGLNQAQLDALEHARGLKPEDIYPLSPMQQGMLFHALHDVQAGLYVDQLCLEVEGLEVGRLRHAWTLVLMRHEVLRSGFMWEGGLEQPLEVVYQSVAAQVTEEDWRGRVGPERELSERASQERRRGFNLKCPPLQRVLVVRLSEWRYRVVWTHHHLVTDGWSTALQLEEVLRAYRGEALGAPVGRYRDYIAWLGERDAAAGERFWRRWLKQLEGPTLLADAFGSRRGADRGGKAGHGVVEFTLAEATVERLRGFAQRQRVTLNTVVQGMWLWLLRCYTGQEVVCFGATVAGRPAELVGAERMLGLFINTLPVIARVTAHARLGEWLRELQQENVAVRENEHVALYEIQLWAGRAGQSLFDSVLVFENYPVDEVLRSVEGDPCFRVVEGVETTNYALTVTAGTGLCMGFRFSYRREHLTRKQVEQIASHLRGLLERLPEADGASALGQLVLMEGVERQRHLELAGGGTTEVDEAATTETYCVHERIEAQAAARPEAVAVVYGERRLTYEELNARANRLAHYLVSQGVGPEVRVGVAVVRSLDLVVALLGVLKAGGAYVPLDPEYPAERLGFMVEDSGIALLLTHAPARLDEELAASLAKICRLDDDAADARLARYPEADPVCRMTPANAAYCIYTSGSTGRPKGVVVCHGNVVNLIASMAERPGIAPGERMLGLTSLSFDIAALELYLPLAYGGCLVLAEAGPREAGRVIDCIHRQGVTIVQATPSSWRMLLECDDGHRLRPVKALCGGEAMPADVAQRLLACCTQVWNMYGPTETTIWSALHEVTVAHASPPLGQPVRATGLYVLDTSMEPVPPGTVGEIYIGGAGVARGYLYRAALSAESFVPNPFGAPGTRLYRTGDLGRRCENGTLEYIGRTDHQAKIRGLRIEPGEIEARLLACAGVENAVVVPRENERDVQLIGYVAAGATDGSLEARLRNELLSVLPDYMVPSKIVCLPKLPLTPNGKVDRDALPSIEVRSAPYVAARTALEKQLAEIWQHALAIDRIGSEDNFFELGGHSLLALRVAIEIQHRRLGSISVADIFHCQTIRQLARRIELGADGSSFVVRLRGGPGGPPVYCLPTFFGKVGGYCRLVNALHGDYPVIGLQARWLDDPWKLDDSIEEIAATYASYLASRHQGASCVLLGWSWGGVLAYELARQLAPQIEVEMIGMVDIHDLSQEFDRHGRPLAAQQRRELRTGFESWIRESPFQTLWRQLMAKASRHEFDVALNYFTARRSLWSAEPGASIDAPEYVDIILLNTLIITRRYAFKPYDVPIRCWNAAESLIPGSGLIDWSLYSPDTEVVAVLAGVTHDTIIESAALIGSVDECLARLAAPHSRAIAASEALTYQESGDGNALQG